MSRDVRTSLSVIEEWIGPFTGRRILDVGCGHGALSRALTKRGAQMTGIDPQAEAVAAAQASVPEATFTRASAEALPYGDGAFDAAVILNALHHVPEAVMGAALLEAARVSAGPLLVIEPLAEGTFFTAMRPVEDETEIRAQAQAAIAAAISTGKLRCLKQMDYEDRRLFATPAAFLAKVIEVDPARAAIAAREEGRVAEIISQLGEPTEGGVALMQPHRAHLLALA